MNMTDNMQRARERISDMVLEVLACEPCIGTCESEESFAHRIAVAAAMRLAVPEGFVVVPREPTESMVEAICAAHAAGGWPDGYGKHAQGLHRAHAQIGYRAMLAAAPKPEDS